LVAKSRSVFESALAQRQHEYEVLLNTANSLFRFVKSKTPLTPENITETLSYVRSKYELLILLRPNDLLPLVNHAAVILLQAKTKIGSEANDLVALAQSKFEQLIKAHPNQHQRVIILTQQGKALLNFVKQLPPQFDLEKAKSLLEIARSKYEAAMELRPSDLSVIKNYSLILLEQAKLSPGGDALRQTVNTKFQSLYNYFVSLTKQKEESEEQSEGETTPRKKIQYLNSLLHISSAVLEQASQKIKGNATNWLEESNKLYDQVKVVLKDLEGLIKENYNYYGFCSYQVAVLFAQLGKEDSCKEWLLRAQTNNVLPSKELIASDSLLKCYQDREWFQEFLASLP